MENLSYCIQCIIEEMDSSEEICDLSEITQWILTLTCNDVIPDDVSDRNITSGKPNSDIT